MRTMRRGALRVVVIGMALLAVACASTKSKETLLTETLRLYHATIRWHSIEQAETFVDPAYRATHPLTALELERYRQVRFTGYSEGGTVPVSDTEVRQAVEITLVNVNTQASRTVIDRQTWTYDATGKRWMLSSGLPDITQSN
ncbi:hypothetical protein ACQQ2N_08370 [Dokdonella sp. MW10]|uniref:hypothetical protein n=1 Tax=Dokdonella sp. MW10 TaxID=2992926 RepID=UPI003F819FB3